MRTQQVMFMGWLAATGIMISLTFGGVWLGGSEVGLASDMTVFKQGNILGIWAVSIPNVGFFVGAAKAVMTMDFAFFRGPAQLFQWIAMLVFGYAFMWGIFTIVIGVIQGLFRRG